MNPPAKAVSSMEIVEPDTLESAATSVSTIITPLVLDPVSEDKTTENVASSREEGDEVEEENTSSQLQEDGNITKIIIV